MAQVNKLDSNITGLAYAEEAAIGYLPGENGLGGTPVWRRLEPNSYNDFGGEIKTVAPNPINPSRQRRKGVAVDIEAAGGFNHNLSFYNLLDMMQGAMFADLRKKGEYTPTQASTTADDYTIASTTGILANHLVYASGFVNPANNGMKIVDVVNAGSIEVTANLVTENPAPAGARVNVVGYQAAIGDIDITAAVDTFPRMTSTTLNFTTLGLVVGQWIYLGGDASDTKFTNEVNNGFKRVRSIAAGAVVFDKTGGTMVTEANTTATIQIFFGDVLKNEVGSLIKRRSYNMERTLGAPDNAAPASIQSEVLKGCVINEVTMNIPQAELITVDMMMMAIDNEQRIASLGPKQTGVLTATAADVMNSTSDVARIRMSILDPLNSAPTPLFAFLTEATFTINNNVTVDKAVGVFGGFDMTVGTFEVGGSVTAYFSNVTAVQAVRNNSNVTIDMILTKNNQGIVFDLPLVSLGDGRLNVEQDAAITLPLSMDAATAVDIDPNMDYTAMFTYFHYLPTVAN